MKAEPVAEVRGKSSHFCFPDFPRVLGGPKFFLGQSVPCESFPQETRSQLAGSGAALEPEATVMGCISPLDAS